MASKESKDYWCHNFYLATASSPYQSKTYEERQPEQLPCQTSTNNDQSKMGKIT